MSINYEEPKMEELDLEKLIINKSGSWLDPASEEDHC